jgi:predicted XRE-type DNA-binding protein
VKERKEVKLFTESSGNVFKDLGFPNAEEMLAKANLASSINEILRKRKLTQKEAAEVLGISQPNVSLLNRGILNGFSLERLMRFLGKLNQNVDIVIHVTPNKKTLNKRGHVRVMHA